MEQDCVNSEWEAEAKALKDLTNLNHENIIQRIAAITQGSRRYFMFQWADGGTLRDFWTDFPRPPLTPTFVMEIVTQLRGLADALHELHVYNNGSYRHGDLKPENILIFKNSTKVGVFKIADMGLAKHHTEATYLRPPTSTRYGTVRYEAPEVVTHKLSENGRSRLYDVWSIGCITLELIVWLLYGYEELTEFNRSLKGSMADSSPYFEVERDSDVAHVHPSVVACMEHISKDIECAGHTAIKDLLDLVKTKLLVVALPIRRPSRIRNPALDRVSNNVVVTGTDESQASKPSPVLFRTTAKHLRNQLDKVIKNGSHNELYWSSGKKRDAAKGPCSSRLPTTISNGLLLPESAIHIHNKLMVRGRNSGEAPLKETLSHRPNVSCFKYSLSYFLPPCPHQDRVFWNGQLLIKLYA